MIICICKCVSDREIRRLVDEGATSLADIRRETELGTQCGKCACEARRMVRELTDNQSPLAGLANLAYELTS